MSDERCLFCHEPIIPSTQNDEGDILSWAHSEALTVQCLRTFTIATPRNAVWINVDELRELRAEIERLSPPLAPVLEWREKNGAFFSGPWKVWWTDSILGAEEGAWFLDFRGVSMAEYLETSENAQLLASSIQRLLEGE